MICALCGDVPGEHRSYNPASYAECAERVLGVRVLEPGALVCWDCLLILSVCHTVCLRVTRVLWSVGRGAQGL